MNHSRSKQRTVGKMTYPKWINVRQHLDAKCIENPYHSMQEQLQARQDKFPTGKRPRIAITAGSRFIANIVTITKAVVDYLLSRGGQPFIVPAMGSHGGATDEGQLQVLSKLGITEEALGVPIHSSMEVVQLGSLENIPVYIDKYAYEADAIVVINRIKPHQVFRGDIQSGLNKMLAVGLGKQKGADAIHTYGSKDILGAIGDFIRCHVPILFGVAILENAYDETRNLAVIDPDQFKMYDQQWAQQSLALLPKIPIQRLDLLIVDKMGKDISGSGMDTNVIGFTRRIQPSGQMAVPLAVLDLSYKTEGNAMGIGLADFTTRKLVEKIHYQTTYTNVLATGIYSAGRIPITFETDKEILDTIIQKLTKSEEARIVRIQNTLHLEHFLITEKLLEEVLQRPQLRIDPHRIETCFDENGNFNF